MGAGASVPSPTVIYPPRVVNKRMNKYKGEINELVKRMKALSNKYTIESNRKKNLEIKQKKIGLELKAAVNTFTRTMASQNATEEQKIAAENTLARLLKKFNNQIANNLKPSKRT